MDKNLSKFSNKIGILTALREFQRKLVEHKISIFVHRAGKHYEEGLREIDSTLGIPLFVFGSETHVTAICAMALGKRQTPQSCKVAISTDNFLIPVGQQQLESKNVTSETNGSNGKKFFNLI